MQLTLPRCAAPLRRLHRDRSGVALIEFAFSAPLVLALGLYGAEMGNQALTHMRISQIALNMADNASRTGLLATNNIESLREGDVNDILQAARLQGAGIKLSANGRITLSSLENIQQSYDTAPVQRIHWQRCMGQKAGVNYDVTDPLYTTKTTDGTTANASDAGKTVATGMGDGTAKVSAPPGSGVMFVEINYLYQPLVSTWLAQPFRMHYTASLIVRNNRDFRQLFNPLNSATLSTCDLHKP